jgi:hypothetical protein
MQAPFKEGQPYCVKFDTRGYDMTKSRIGDIAEIKTEKGLAYAQYTHKHKQFGALIRIFSKLYESRLSDVSQLADAKVAFVCFFPLNAAISKGIVTNIGNITVPLNAQKFPTFRDGVADPKTGKVNTWWLWDGENEWKVGVLTPEQRKFPIRGVWNDTLLVERIQSGWTPEKDSE